MPSINILLEQSLMPVNGFQDLKLAFAPYVKDMEVFKQTKTQKLLEFISKIYLPKLLKLNRSYWGGIKHFKYANSEEKGRDLKSRINTKKYT